MSSSNRPSRFEPYKNALATISKRTRTPLPSLIVSFAVLHEVTAVLPVIGFFYAAQGLGTGPAVVNYVSERVANLDELDDGMYKSSLKAMDEYLDEGERRAVRFGQRYKLWGLDRDAPPSDAPSEGIRSRALAGDIANAAVAYGITKALFPVRIAASLWLAPAFSRGLVEPLRRGFLGLGRLFR